MQQLSNPLKGLILLDIYDRIERAACTVCEDTFTLTLIATYKRWTPDFFFFLKAQYKYYITDNFFFCLCYDYRIGSDIGRFYKINIGNRIGGKNSYRLTPNKLQLP